MHQLPRKAPIYDHDHFEQEASNKQLSTNHNKCETTTRRQRKKISTPTLAKRMRRPSQPRLSTNWLQDEKCQIRQRGGRETDSRGPFSTLRTRRSVESIRANQLCTRPRRQPTTEFHRHTCHNVAPSAHTTARTRATRCEGMMWGLLRELNQKQTKHGPQTSSFFDVGIAPYTHESQKITVSTPIE